MVWRCGQRSKAQSDVSLFHFSIIFEMVERAGGKKRARIKHDPLPSTWDPAPLVIPPGEEFSPPWQIIQRRWKRKHSNAKRRRWLKREKLHEKWRKAQMKPPRKRQAKPVARKKTFDGSFWNRDCAELSSFLWLPCDQMMDTIGGETSPTWFDTKTSLLPFHRPHRCNQEDASQRACNIISTIVKNQEADALAKKKEVHRKKNVERRANGEAETTWYVPVDDLHDTKCKSFHMKPTIKQLETLDMFMKGATYCHNRAVRAFNTLSSAQRMEVDQKTLIKLAQLDNGGDMVKDAAGRKRKQQVVRVTWKDHAPRELVTLPYIVRKNVVRGLLQKRAAWKAKACNKDQELKFKERSGKEVQESFYIEQSQINIKTFDNTPGVANLRSIFGIEKDRSVFPSRTKLPTTFEADCRIVHNRVHDKWKLCFPAPLEKKTPALHAVGKVVSIDPGIRTFATATTLEEKRLLNGANAEDALVVLLAAQNSSNGFVARLIAFRDARVERNLSRPRQNFTSKPTLFARKYAFWSTSSTTSWQPGFVCPLQSFFFPSLV
jgi:hypothetical protein